MSNPIKYSTGSESLALKTGNFYIGTGDVGKGPTSTTGYYNGITPPSGGYTIYLNKATGGPSIYTCANDTELISLTNSIAGTSYTTANECLVYFAGQTDKMVLNRDYEGIVTDGLIMNLDAGFTPSYPKNGTTWYDLGGNNNGTLTNGPTFSSADGGSVVFDGVDDVVTLPNTNFQFSNQGITYEVWVDLQDNPNTYRFLIGNSASSSVPRINFAKGRSGYNSGKVYMQLVVSGTRTEARDSLNGEDYPTEGILHLVGVIEYSSGVYKAKMYRNGVLINTAGSSITTYTMPSNNVVTLGNASSFGATLNGPMYVARVYDRTLSSSEILQNFNAQKGRFGL